MMAIFFIRKKALSRANSSELTFNPEDADYLNKAAAGKTATQMVSYVLHIIVSIIGILILLMFFFVEVLDSNGDIFNLSIFLFFGLLFITPVIIIANWFWIYPKRIVHAEAYAIFHKTISSRFSHQRILAWCVWIPYTLVIIAFFVFQPWYF
jgi:uncharacterized membrane protein YkgB